MSFTRSPGSSSDHLHVIRPRVTSGDVLARDLSLHNDVLFSLLTVCQLVIDVAGERSARRGERFQDYTEAVRNLAREERFRPPLDDLQPIEQFAEIVLRLETARLGGARVALRGPTVLPPWIHAR